MALQRPVAKALGCHNCQRWVLGSFMAAMGVQSSPTAARATHGQRGALSRSIASFEKMQTTEMKTTAKEEHPLDKTNDTYNAVKRNLQIARNTEVEGPAEQDEGAEKTALLPENTGKDQEQSASEYIPWYLQAQSSTDIRPENPLTARQRIPDLPEHSPAILQPLLEHVSVELGIDDLSILDLRSLDPPPALGANLFMIIGTARSEKHLHVSADRLCRWLRSTYKMRPYADGLLGRNEMKLKMRRKAKRSKLLSAVGAKATADSDVDDGIRTGWVCVNLGMIEGGELPKTEEQIAQEKMIVGFGTQTGGSNVVVQMMTEEKRGEIDLENLWTETLRRSRVKQEKLRTENEPREDGGANEEPVDGTIMGETSAASLPSHAYTLDQNTGAHLRA